MLKKSMLLALLMALGCGEEKGGEDTPKESDKGGKVTKDASTRDARSGSDEEVPDDENIIDGDGKDAGIDDRKPPTVDDAGSIEVKAPDGGTVIITPNQDGGAQLTGMGSCCEKHDTPGCNNGELMVCVCELRPACCTEAWDPSCALIVNSRWCQEGVRDCVCDPGGKVGQETCCKDEWTRTCDVYAKGQCDAVPGCF